MKQGKLDSAIDEILSGARKVFAKHGFVGASISTITKTAGVSRGLVYHYFRDKLHLWKEVKKDALKRAQANEDFGAGRARTFREFLEIVVRERFKFYRDHPDIHLLVTWEKLEGRGALLGLGSALPTLWQKELAALQLHGEIRKDVDIRLLSFLLLSSIAGAFDYVPLFCKSSEKAKQQEAYLSMLIDGLHAGFHN